MKTAGHCLIRTLVRSKVPSVPFEAIKNRIVGTGYELSVTINGDALARRLNKKHRGKTYAANVLSFPLSKTEGEMFLNVRKAAREAKSQGVTVQYWLIYLYIHGLLHLKGFNHGGAMERAQERLVKEFATRA